MTSDAMHLSLITLCQHCRNKSFGIMHYNSSGSSSVSFHRRLVRTIIRSAPFWAICCNRSSTPNPTCRCSSVCLARHDLHRKERSWQLKAAQSESHNAALSQLYGQQKLDQHEPYNVLATQVLVETAMFAAVGGLAFSVAAVFKLQSYLGYLMPLPVVLSAMRSGPRLARKTTVATAVLLMVLLGPLQAASYVLQHGFAAWTLGSLWAVRAPWWLSILVASCSRMAGIIGFLAFTSWTLNENVYRLLVTQIHSLLDQMGALIGASGSPSTLVIQVVMASVLLVNCVMYVTLLHVIYAIMLRSMGYKAMQMPHFLEKRLLPVQLHATQ